MRQIKRHFLFVPVSIAIATPILLWLTWVEYALWVGVGMLSCIFMPFVLILMAMALIWRFAPDLDKSEGIGRCYRGIQVLLSILLSYFIVLNLFWAIALPAGEIGRKQLLQSKATARILLDYHQQQNEPAPHILDPGQVSQKEIDRLNDHFSWSLMQESDQWYVDAVMAVGFLDDARYRYTTTAMEVNSCQPLAYIQFWYYCGRY